MTRLLRIKELSHGFSALHSFSQIKAKQSSKSWRSCSRIRESANPRIRKRSESEASPKASPKKTKHGECTRVSSRPAQSLRAKSKMPSIERMNKANGAAASWSLDQLLMHSTLGELSTNVAPKRLHGCAPRRPICQAAWASRQAAHARAASARVVSRTGAAAIRRDEAMQRRQATTMRLRSRRKRPK